ncbi:MAG: CotH kinase family protein [Saprospiraceae bacterium]|nr:CotH kinase family protein [Saprospiraceae bacterium]
MMDKIHAQDFYDLNQIQTIKIYFSANNWRYQLDTSKAGKEGFIIADSVIINQKKFVNSGVKFKGNSTYSINRVKNPLHIKLDYVKSADYQGYDDIKLSNGWSDNSMIREPLAFYILRQYMDAPKSNFAKVFINNQYYGLMNNTESIDKRFVLKNYSSSYNTFVKCNPESIGGTSGNGPNLEFFDFNISSYNKKYEMESDTGWAALMELIFSLNQDFSRFEKIADIDKLIWMLAFNNVLVNLDSYSGSFRQNYYLYQNHESVWIPTIWDLNMCFGGFATPGGITGALNPTTMQTMAFNLHKNEAGWPLIFKFLNDPFYSKMYFAHMRTIMQENFLLGQFKTIATQIHQMIDLEVKNDLNSLVSYDQFVQALTTNTNGLNGAPASPGIFPLMDGRANYLKNVLSATAPVIETPVLGTNRKFGERISVTVKVSNYTNVFLYYRNGTASKFSFLEMKDDGLHGDGAANDQVFGEEVQLLASQLQYYIYAENISTGKFLPERAAHEYFSIFADNRKAKEGDLVINEILSSNSKGIYNEKGSFGDWLELYNRTNEVLSLEDISLSDDPSKNTKWTFSNSSFILPNEHMLIWADDENDYYLHPHTNFKLGNNAGYLSMSYGGNVIYSNAYGSIPSDQSLGRCADGIGPFIAMLNPSPQLANFCQTSTDQNSEVMEWSIYPNPADDQIIIESQSKIQNLNILDLSGRTVLSIQNGSPFSISKLEKGIYFVQISNGFGQIGTKKLIKL